MSDAVRSVSPRRLALGAGLLVGMYLLAVFMVQPVPPRLVALLGGAQTAFEREGGLVMAWIPPRDLDAASLDRIRAARSGRATVVERDGTFELRVAGVRSDQIEEVAKRIAKDRLAFHEVLELDEMKQLASILNLPMKGQHPVDIEIDQWRPDEIDRVYTDYYLLGDSPQVIEAELAEAARRGWSLPAGTRIALQKLEPLRAGDVPQWRTYVIRTTAELDGFSIANATGSYDPNTNRPIVLLDFDREGGRIFGEVTGRIAGHKLAILVGEEVRSAPIINSAIRGGRASITMGGSDPRTQEHERDMLIETLKVGALPPGGEVVGSLYVAPSDDAPIRWLARLALVLGGGLLAGLLAWLAARFARPVWRPAPARAEGPLPWSRLGVTLLAPAVILVLSHVTVLGIDTEEYLFRVGGAGWLGAMRSDPMQYISVGALGFMPILSSFVLVELLAVVIPGWRRRRHAGPLAREPIWLTAIFVSALLVAVQGWFFVQYMASLGDIVRPGLLPRLEIIASLGAGTLALAIVALVIRRHGVGNGFSALIVAGWAIHVEDTSSHVGYLSGDTVLGGLTFVVIAIIVGVGLRLRVRRDEIRTLRVPTSGLAPLSDAGGLVIALVLLTRIPLDQLIAKLTAWTLELHDHRWSMLVVVAVLTILWSLAFARRAAGSSRVWWAATGLSIVILVLVAAIATFGLSARPTISWVIDGATAALVAGWLVDVFDDLRARRTSLEQVWALHSAQHVDVAEHALAEAGIPAHFTATHTRTLLAFFGPFVPIDVLVPVEHAPAAKQVLASLELP